MSWMNKKQWKATELKWIATHWSESDKDVLDGTHGMDGTLEGLSECCETIVNLLDCQRTL